MALNIWSADIHHLFDQFTELVDGHIHHKKSEQQLTIPPHMGKGSMTRTRIRPGMEIVVTDLTFEQNMKLHIQEACPLFELSYCLNGEIYCEWNGKESHTNRLTGNVLYLEDELVYEEKKAGVHHQMVEIRCSPQELISYAGDIAEKHSIETWLQRYKGNIDAYADTPAMHKCVYDMIHCNYNGTMKRLYMESKAMEFIALFGEMDGHVTRGISHFISREDISKLHKAREFVILHFEHPLSIQALARKVGLNEFKLKKGFPHLFGMTIFEMVRKQRMEKALWYLEVEQLNIGETAFSIGYSNASNFTTTFRKYYGCNPSEYIKKIRNPDTFTNKF